jgi:hypothetical protein
MGQRRVIVAILMVSILLLVPAIQGYEGGVYNQASGCNCHSQSGTSPASVSISGLPASYDVNKLYQVTVSVSGGVSGSNGGFSLEVDKGTLSTGFGLMLVNVNSQGNSATHSITGSSYRSWSFEWTSPAAGAGTVNFEVAGMTTNGNGQNSGDRWVTDVVQVPENIPVNNPPSASNVMLSPTDAKTAESLTLSYTYSDPDNDPQSGTEITWYRDSQALPSGTITGLTVPPSQTTKGQDWYATVRPSDGVDYGALQTSNTVTIENTPPTLAAPEITPPAPDGSEDLAVSYSVSDDDQDSLTIEIHWYLDGVLVTEFNNDTTVPSIATREGDEWRVEVSVSDGEDFETRSSQIITIGQTIQPNNPPEVTSPTISPSLPTTLNDLFLTYNTQDLDGDQIIATQIEWRMDNTLTVESSTIVQSSATQRGQIWSASIRVSDGINWSVWSSVDVTIMNSAPVIGDLQLAPTNSYTNDSLSFTYAYSDFDDDAMAPPTITWYKNSVEQTDLLNQNTIPSSLTNKGENWTVSVYGNDGTDLSIEPLQSSVLIQNSNPSVIIEEIPLNISFVDNQALGLTILPEFTDADNDQINFQISWLRNGFREGSLDNLTFVAAQYFGAGQSWTCQITFDDSDAQPQVETWEINVDNVDPVANINIESANLWSGELIVINATQSYDLDGIISNYYWQWDDNFGNQMSSEGEIISIITTGTTIISLTVEDDLGSIATTTRSLQTTQGPTISALAAQNDDGEVDLNWQWDGEQATFLILRNNFQIDETNELKFSDSPTVAGSTNYTVIPVIDGQQLVAGSMTISDFEVDTTVESASGLSETGGFYLGLLFLAVSILITALGLLQRRDKD